MTIPSKLLPDERITVTIRNARVVGEGAELLIGQPEGLILPIGVDGLLVDLTDAELDVIRIGPRIGQTGELWQDGSGRLWAVQGVPLNDPDRHLVCLNVAHKRVHFASAALAGMGPWVRLYPSAPRADAAVDAARHGPVSRDSIVDDDRPTPGHTTEVTEPTGPDGDYGWRCTCGDGIDDGYLTKGRAFSATREHELSHASTVDDQPEHITQTYEAASGYGWTCTCGEQSAPAYWREGPAEYAGHEHVREATSTQDGAR